MNRRPLSPNGNNQPRMKGIIVTDYLYRVRITAYPEGACVLGQFFLPEDEKWYWMPAAGWAPPGWTPSSRYRNTLGGTDFSWPSTKTVYRSLGAARRRARLLESFGASVVIDRSAEIIWPPGAPIKARPSELIEVPQ